MTWDFEADFQTTNDGDDGLDGGVDLEDEEKEEGDADGVEIGEGDLDDGLTEENY